MPVYNKAPYLKEAISSILNQSFGDFELLVVDDASQDESLAIVSSIKDSRIQLHENKKNLGTGGNANLCIALAKGKYIARMDADDIAFPKRLAMQWTFMEEHPEIDISSGHCEIIGRENALWKMPLDDAEIKAQLLFGSPISQGASIMRSSFLEQSGIRYNEGGSNVAEDWLFWFKCRNQARFANLDSALIQYRKGSNNVTDQTQEQEFKTFTNVFGTFFKELELSFSERELLLHFYTRNFFHLPVTKTTVVDYKKWLERLKTSNKKEGWFDPAHFDRIADKHWQQFFYKIVPMGWGPILAHAFHSNAFPTKKLNYAIKFHLKKSIG